MKINPKNWLLKSLALFLPLLMTLSASAEYEEIIYYHNDALGSPVLATDANGDVLWQEDYTPSGSRLRHESRELSGPLAEPQDDQWDETTWFTGKQEATRLGILNFGARWYEPELGRFLAIDPAGVRGHIEVNPMMFNPYAYANNNPYKYVDPDGREVVSVNSKNNARLTTYINNLTSGVFKFNNDNRLEMVSSSGGSGGSDFYTSQLNRAINKDSTISIDIKSGPNTSSEDVQTKFNTHTGDSKVTITDDTYNLKGFGDTVVAAPPDLQLAHELVEHAIPNMDGKETKNGVPAFRENIVRRENNMPRRSGEDH